jgi:hypothetical protein
MNEFHLILSNPHYECRLKSGGSSTGLDRVSKKLFRYTTPLSPIHHLLEVETTIKDYVSILPKVELRLKKQMHPNPLIKMGFKAEIDWEKKKFIYEVQVIHKQNVVDSKIIERNKEIDLSKPEALQIAASSSSKFEPPTIKNQQFYPYSFVEQDRILEITTPISKGFKTLAFPLCPTLLILAENVMQQTLQLREGQQRTSDWKKETYRKNFQQNIFWGVQQLFGQMAEPKSIHTKLLKSKQKTGELPKIESVASINRLILVLYKCSILAKSLLHFLAFMLNPAKITVAYFDPPTEAVLDVFVSRLTKPSGATSVGHIMQSLNSIAEIRDFPLNSDNIDEVFAQLMTKSKHPVSAEREFLKLVKDMPLDPFKFVKNTQDNRDPFIDHISLSMETPIPKDSNLRKGPVSNQNLHLLTENLLKQLWLKQSSRIYQHNLKEPFAGDSATATEPIPTFSFPLGFIADFNEPKKIKIFNNSLGGSKLIKVFDITAPTNTYYKVSKLPTSKVLCCLRNSVPQPRTVTFIECSYPEIYYHSNFYCLLMDHSTREFTCQRIEWKIESNYYPSFDTNLNGDLIIIGTPTLWSKFEIEVMIKEQNMASWTDCKTYSLQPTDVQISCLRRGIPKLADEIINHKYITRVSVNTRRALIASTGNEQLCLFSFLFTGAILPTSNPQVKHQVDHPDFVDPKVICIENMIKGYKFVKTTCIRDKLYGLIVFDNPLRYTLLYVDEKALKMTVLVDASQSRLQHKHSMQSVCTWLDVGQGYLCVWDLLGSKYTGRKKKLELDNKGGLKFAQGNTLVLRTYRIVV